MASDIDRRAAELAARPYTRMVTPGDEGGFTVQVLEIPGAITEGDTADEALANACEALEGVIAVMLEDGTPIPDPLEGREFSGVLQLRIPPSLHRTAATHARLDGVSLNRWLSAAVATYAGHETARRESRPA